MWQGAEVERYEILKKDAKAAGRTIPDFVKDLLASALKAAERGNRG